LTYGYENCFEKYYICIASNYPTQRFLFDHIDQMQSLEQINDVNLTKLTENYTKNKSDKINESLNTNTQGAHRIIDIGCPNMQGAYRIIDIGSPCLIENQTLNNSKKSLKNSKKFCSVM
jgi:hypothetical protein